MNNINNKVLKKVGSLIIILIQFNFLSCGICMTWDLNVAKAIPADFFTKKQMILADIAYESYKRVELPVENPEQDNYQLHIIECDDTWFYIFSPESMVTYGNNGERIIDIFVIVPIEKKLKKVIHDEVSLAFGFLFSEMNAQSLKEINLSKEAIDSIVNGYFVTQGIDIKDKEIEYLVPYTPINEGLLQVMLHDSNPTYGHGPGCRVYIDIKSKKVIAAALEDC